MAAAQVRAGDVLDKSVEHMAAQCARRVAIDKLEDATDALRAAQDSRVVSLEIIPTRDLLLCTVTITAAAFVLAELEACRATLLT